MYSVQNQFCIYTTRFCGASRGLGWFQSLNQGPQGGVEIGYLAGRPRDIDPAHDAAAVDGEGARQLPAGPALGGAVPDALGLAELDGAEEARGPDGVPVRGQAEPPARVEVAARVDDDVRLPGAADLLDPAVGGGRVRVRDGDAAQDGAVRDGEGG